MISPCVRICTMDAESGLCEGCGRTIDEIANWTRMNDTERQVVMDALPARLEAKRAAEQEADLRPRRERVAPGGWRSR
ncbi:DUF1289 domain-containing protein [Mesorhizobium sp. BR1-1-16]|uniref:DUF1289 domain-containing protein n=1 Tax=Mesorhizobium sp. BR1-1-16 TaxID=2876653 RepID=UPI001CC95AB3|nr:DUF1289 domain-containing protein [Mesorhizobium sp. BR1-1-16]MBZ9939346.1 DUF1289 domain-containing protein [Mesorhizobium sp. BR1-1-16]